MASNVGNSARSSLAMIGVTAAAALLLLVPALLNRFPLIFPDTGAYMSVAWAKTWTLDRSGFYGLALKPFSGLPALGQVWIAVILQSLVNAVVLMLAMRAMIPRSSSAAKLGVVTLLALATSLPWHSSQLMPDALTGACILLTWLAAGRDPTSSGTPTLWLGAVITGLFHYTHLILVPVAAAASLVAQFSTGKSLSDLRSRALAATAATLAILAWQVAANGYFLQRWTISPVGSTFLFARLNEDGLIQPWMQRHCGEVPELCRAYPEMPRDSQKLLWDHNSPFETLIWSRMSSDTDGPMLSEVKRAAIGSIGEQPGKFLVGAGRATADQFVHFAALDDECPEVCTSPISAVYGLFKLHRPELMPPFEASPQFRGQLPKAAVRAVTTPVAALSMILLLAAAAFACRRRDGPALSLALAVLAVLVVNAALAGALSDVHDRYQSRVVWLAPFALLLSVLRFAERKALQPAAGSRRAAEIGEASPSLE